MIHVSSEIGTLKKVLVHRPDDGIDRISPKRAEELLFDDIVYLPKMRMEHDVFTSILKMFLGDDNVYEIEQLLEEALSAQPVLKDKMIDLICQFEELPYSSRLLLKSLSNPILKETLITGYYEEEDIYIFDPIPNFLFTRDIAVVVNDHVIITKAAKSARFRENYLTQFIFNAHPMFKELQDNNRIINLNDVEKFPPSKRGESISAEGGDIMMISKDYLLIGCSERTSSHAIQLLKNVLFEKNVVQNVVQINISKARSWMHIDTVFTHVHHNHVAAYKPLVIEGLASGVKVFRKGQEQVDGYTSVSEFFKAELNEEMDYVLSGNNEYPYDEREQWTDGCNLVALKPGVALSYDRNVKTAKAFENKGYKIIAAEDLLADFKTGKITAEQVENTIITLPSSELSRARGGSHCMTCPISREEI